MSNDTKTTRCIVITATGYVYMLHAHSYRDLQHSVGGLITTSPVRSDKVIPLDSTVFANDEGLLIGLPPNAAAQAVTGYPYLVGDIIIAGGVDEYGDTLSIADETIVRIMEAIAVHGNPEDGE